MSESGPRPSFAGDLLGSAAVGEPGTAFRAGVAAACVAALAALQLPAAIGAESSSELREHAQSLRDENAALARQARAAWLSSASLGTRLEQTRAGLARLQARTRSIAAERAEADESLRLARRTLALSQQRLADRVRLLYEQGDSGPDGRPRRREVDRRGDQRARQHPSDRAARTGS